MEVSGQLHVPAASPSGKESHLPSQYEAEKVQRSIWTLWSRDKSLVPTGNRNPAGLSVGLRYTD
jgi:hypothetical protein